VIIVDASIVVKWFVSEGDSANAVQIFENEAYIAAPDLVLPEVTNTFRKKVKAGDAHAVQIAQALPKIRNSLALLVSSAELTEESWALACRLDHSPYDCFYLALALKNQTVLVTADKKFVRKCRAVNFMNVVDVQNFFSRNYLCISDDLIQKIYGLYSVAEQTLDHVIYKVMEGKTGLLKTYLADEILPAYDSPAYLNMAAFLKTLPFVQLMEVISLCWFSSLQCRDFKPEIGQALATAPAEVNIDYIISKLHNLKAGYEKFKNSQVD
jgi:predicted nucleic acid-binding protein